MDAAERRELRHGHGATADRDAAPELRPTSASSGAATAKLDCVLAGRTYTISRSSTSCRSRAHSMRRSAS